MLADAQTSAGRSAPVERLLGGLGPLPPLLGVGAGLGGLLVPARGLGLECLPLELFGAGAELSRPGFGLGVHHGGLGGRAGVPHLLLHCPQPSLEFRGALPGHLAEGIPLGDYRAQRGARGVLVGRVDALRLGQQGLFGRGIRLQLGITLGIRGVAGGEEGVLGGLEALPERLIDVLRGPPR